MPGSVQSFSVFSMFLELDAKEHQDIPSLNKNSNQQCLEFFFDNSKIPNFVVLNGRITQATPPAKTGCVCVAGDDGPIFIQVFGKTLLDKRGDWQFPDLDYSPLQEKMDLLSKKTKSFYAGVR